MFEAITDIAITGVHVFFALLVGIPIIALISMYFMEGVIKTDYIATYSINNSFKEKHGKYRSIHDIYEMDTLKERVEKQLLKQGAKNITVYTPTEWQYIKKSSSNIESKMIDKNCKNCGSTSFTKHLDTVKCDYCKTIYK